MPPPTAPRNEHVKVIFVDIPGSIVVDENFTQATTYNEFTSILGRISGGLKLEGIDLSAKSLLGECWWYRIVRNIKGQENSAEFSVDRVGKGDWKMLNNSCAYDRLIGEVTLGVAFKDGWIEVQHDLQKKRDEAAVKLAQISMMIPVLDPQEDTVTSETNEEDVSAFGDDSSETSTTSQEVREVQDFLLANAVCPGQTADADQESWVLRYKTYKPPLILHGDLPSYTERPGPFPAQIGNVPLTNAVDMSKLLHDNGFDSCYEDTQGGSYSNQNNHTADSLTGDGLHQQYYDFEDGIFPTDETSTQNVVDGWIPERKRYQSQSRGKGNHQNTPYFDYIPSHSPKTPDVQYSIPHGHRKLVPGHGQFNYGHPCQSPAGSQRPYYSNAFQTSAFPPPSQDVVATDGFEIYSEQQRRGSNIHIGMSQDSRRGSKRDQIRELESLTSRSRQFKLRNYDQSNPSGNHSQDHVQNSHFQVENLQTASVHPSPTLYPARANLSLFASTNGTAASKFAKANKFHQSLNQSDFYTHPNQNSGSNRRQQFRPTPNPLGSRQWNNGQPEALQLQYDYLQYSMDSSHPFIPSRSHSNGYSKPKPKKFQATESKWPPVHGYFNSPKPRMAQLDARRVLDRYTSSDLAPNNFNNAATARGRAQKAGHPLSNAQGSGTFNREDGASRKKGNEKKRKTNKKESSETNCQTEVTDVSNKLHEQGSELTKNKLEVLNPRAARAKRRSSTKMLEGEQKEVEGNVMMTEG